MNNYTIKVLTTNIPTIWETIILKTFSEDNIDFEIIEDIVSLKRNRLINSRLVILFYWIPSHYEIDLEIYKYAVDNSIPLIVITLSFDLKPNEKLLYPDWYNVIKNTFSTLHNDPLKDHNSTNALSFKRNIFILSINEFTRNFFNYIRYINYNIVYNEDTYLSLKNFRILFYSEENKMIQWYANCLSMRGYITQRIIEKDKFTDFVINNDNVLGIEEIGINSDYEIYDSLKIKQHSHPKYIVIANSYKALSKFSKYRQVDMKNEEINKLLTNNKQITQITHTNKKIK